MHNICSAGKINLNQQYLVPKISEKAVIVPIRDKIQMHSETLQLCEIVLTWTKKVKYVSHAMNVEHISQLIKNGLHFMININITWNLELN